MLSINSRKLPKPVSKSNDLSGNMRAVIRYTQKPKKGIMAVDLDNVSIVPLASGTIAAQHGTVPLERDDEIEVSNVLIPHTCTFLDGREATPQPSFDSLGFEIVDIPHTTTLSTKAAQVAVANGDKDLSQKYYKEISERVRQATGADYAHGFCYALRSTESHGTGYAPYAHTDNSEDSWSARLPEFVNKGTWSERGPPGISCEVATRAAKAKRYAVVTCWRYLGPADACRKCPLGILDHSSLEKGDIMRIYLLANGSAGGNYRPISSSSVSQRHRWYYYSEMKPTEMLVFVAFDSDHPAKNSTFANTPITTCLHGAFIDPRTPKDEPERVSIDARFLLIWD